MKLNFYWKDVNYDIESDISLNILSQELKQISVDLKKQIKNKKIHQFSAVILVESLKDCARFLEGIKDPKFREFAKLEKPLIIDQIKHLNERLYNDSST